MEEEEEVRVLVCGVCDTAVSRRKLFAWSDAVVALAHMVVPNSAWSVL